MFNYNEKGSLGGYTDFGAFQVTEPRYKGLTRPIPYDKIIKIRSIADGSLLVNWRNHVRPVNPESPFAVDSASFFRVLDRGNGRVALQSVKSGGLVTVKGLGGLAEVRIAEDQGDASTFQWQDMLKGDLMLMSLQIHKYLYVDPHAGSLCSADAPGARPDRKGGACFSWEIVSSKK